VIVSKQRQIYALTNPVLNPLALDARLLRVGHMRIMRGRYLTTLTCTPGSKVWTTSTAVFDRGRTLLRCDGWSPHMEKMTRYYCDELLGGVGLGADDWKQRSHHLVLQRAMSATELCMVAEGVGGPAVAMNPREGC
jgi:hypothetical protein